MGKCYPSQCRWEQEARGSKRAVLRANKGEDSHVGSHRSRMQMHRTVGDGCAWSCSRKTIKQVRREKQKQIQKGNHGLSATRFRSEQDPCAHTEQSRAVDLTERMMGGRRKGTHTPPASHVYERVLCYAFSLSARESLTRLLTGGRGPFTQRLSSQAASKERSLCCTEHRHHIQTEYFWGNLQHPGLMGKGVKLFIEL